MYRKRNLFMLKSLYMFFTGIIFLSHWMYLTLSFLMRMKPAWMFKCARNLICRIETSILISVIYWNPPQNLGLKTMIHYFAHCCRLTELCSVVLFFVLRGSRWHWLSWGWTIPYELSFSRASSHMTFNRSVVWPRLLTTMATGFQERTFQKDKPYCANTYPASAYSILTNAR